MYTLRCRYHGREFDLTWQEGEFTGDPNAVLVLESLAAAYEDEAVPVGPPAGPLYTEDYLADPFAALWLVREVFEIVSASGDVPEREPVPEGAVA